MAMMETSSPCKVGGKGKRKSFQIFPMCRPPWNGSKNDTAKGPWGPNGTRRAHGSWYSYVWTNERTTPWGTDAAYIKHGSRRSQTPLASRWSRSDVPVSPQQPWLCWSPSWPWPGNTYHGIAKRTGQRGRSSLHDEECANVRGEKKIQQVHKFKFIIRKVDQEAVVEKVDLK